MNALTEIFNHLPTLLDNTWPDSNWGMMRDSDQLRRWADFIEKEKLRTQ